MSFTPIPTVPNYSGEAPNRTTQNQSEFSANSDNSLQYQTSLSTNLNAATEAINQVADEIQVVAGASEASAIESANSADTSVSNANYKGKWIDLSGAANIPYSVFHDGSNWQLLSNIPDVTASEPSSTNAEWEIIIGQHYVNTNADLHDTLAGATSRTDLVDNPSNPMRIYIVERNAFFSVVTGASANNKDILAAANGLQLSLEPQSQLDIRMLGAIPGDFATVGDHTPFTDRSYEISDNYYLPAGQWNVDTIRILKPFTLRTAGFTTNIQQNPGTPAGTRTVVIDSGGDVRFAESGATVTGNIDTDTGEQHHAVYVFARLNGRIDNVKIGDINGVNIRGDALYIGGSSIGSIENLLNPSLVTFGNITGTDCYRNVVSITGGVGIDGGVIKGNTNGLLTLDFEPDLQGGVVNGFNIKGVIGSTVAILGASPRSVWGDPLPAGVPFDIGERKQINIGFFIGRGDYPVSSSAISPPVTTGLIYRNSSFTHIQSLDLRAYRGEPVQTVYNAASPSFDVRGTGNSIGTCIIRDCLTTSGLYALNLAGQKHLKIDHLDYELFDNATQFAVGGSAGVTGEETTKVQIGYVKGTGPLGTVCDMSVANSDVDFAEDVYCVRSLAETSTFNNSKWNVGRIAGFCGGQITFMSSNLTFSGTLDYDSSVGTSYHVVETNCTKNATWNAIVVDKVPMIQP